MIRVEYLCARAYCSRRVAYPVPSEWYFGNLPFKKYAPKGWGIRTPRGRDQLALAYCPEHAEGALER